MLKVRYEGGRFRIEELSAVDEWTEHSPIVAGEWEYQDIAVLETPGHVYIAVSHFGLGISGVETDTVYEIRKV